VLNNELTFEQVCGALGFTKSKGFIKKTLSPEISEQIRKWLELIERFDIDAVFLIRSTETAPSIPVVYFKKLDKYDETKIVDLHKKIWNEGKIPLLYVILPSEMRIYNCFEPPCFSKDEIFNSKQRLIKYLETLKNVEYIQSELSEYTCEEISSGRFWRDKETVFNINNRADMYLLKNLRTLRRVLQDKRLSNKVIHSLIGRSILLLCLEDRRALKWYFDEFKDGTYANKGFKQVLDSKDITYELFEFLNNQFDGDLFTVTPEEKSQVTGEHLQILRHFLQGTDLETGQSRLWPYRFDYIPLEFISNVYEEFFHYEKEPHILRENKQLATHYTPQFIVDFMLDDILQWDTRETYPKILDPSCGSGIFLVEAYRKLIDREIRIKGNTNIKIEDLKRILKECIFGVDINGEAISITAFSLYLTMMDYIDPESLWKTKKIFPKLTNENLFPFDFFDSNASFNKMQFDVIIGNVPWASVNKDSKTRALSFCKYSHYPISDKQLAQAFMWKSLRLSSDGGKSCLIVSAKSLLFNRSDRNKDFRRSFLKKSNIKTIVNLSAMRHDLFNQSVGPAAIIYYLNESLPEGKTQNPILYITPKPAIETKYVGAIIINESDYANIPLEKAIDNDSIWKIAMWGTPRDLELINKSLSMGTLGTVVKKKSWKIGDGFQRAGGNKNSAPWILDYPHIPTKALDKYYIHKQKLQSLSNPIFHRPREKKRYAAPLCLMKVTLKKGDLVAAFSDFNISYTDGIIGISGSPQDADWLKILCCYLNSSIAKYFLFLTCSVWGVERDDILKSDIMDLPLVLPEKKSNEYRELLAVYNQIAERLEHNKELRELNVYRQRIDAIFFKLFNLSDIEKNLILDTITYTIDYFQRKGKSIATAPVDSEVLMKYVKNSLLLLNSIAEGTGKTFCSEVYSGSETLKVVAFKFHKLSLFSSEDSKIKIHEKDATLENVLADLSPVLYEERCEKVLFRRIIRVYEGNAIYIIKPNETRYWTRIEAYKDADITLADILSAWRENESV